MKGCELGWPRACLNAGLLNVDNFEERTRPRNPKAGIEFLRKVSGLLSSPLIGSLITEKVVVQFAIYKTFRTFR